MRSKAGSGVIYVTLEALVGRGGPRSVSDCTSCRFWSALATTLSSRLKQTNHRTPSTSAILLLKLNHGEEIFTSESICAPSISLVGEALFDGLVYALTFLKKTNRGPSDVAALVAEENTKTNGNNNIFRKTSTLQFP
jgi:hypothetical protein